MLIPTLNRQYIIKKNTKIKFFTNDKKNNQIYILKNEHFEICNIVINTKTSIKDFIEIKLLERDLRVELALDQFSLISAKRTRKNLTKDKVIKARNHQKDEEIMAIYISASIDNLLFNITNEILDFAQKRPNLDLNKTISILRSEDYQNCFTTGKEISISSVNKKTESEHYYNIKNTIPDRINRILKKIAEELSHLSNFEFISENFRLLSLTINILNSNFTTKENIFNIKPQNEKQFSYIYICNFVSMIKKHDHHQVFSINYIH